MKLTLEDITPLREFTITILPAGSGEQQVLAHYAQTRADGVLELFRSVRNITSVVGIYAPGQWAHVAAAPPSLEVVAEIEARVQEAHDAALPLDLVTQAIALSAEEAFPQLKH